jgi:hypothetical protein
MDSVDRLVDAVDGYLDEGYGVDPLPDQLAAVTKSVELLAL